MKVSVEGNKVNIETDFTQPLGDYLETTIRKVIDLGYSKDLLLQSGTLLMNTFTCTLMRPANIFCLVFIVCHLSLL